MGNDLQYALNMYRLRIKNGIPGQLLFFVVWPFGALLHSLQDMKSRNFIFIYSLFGILMCWNLDVVSKSYDDLHGIAALFMQVDNSTQACMQRLHAYITFSSDAPREIYIYFMMWLSRLFSDNPHFFFALCAIPYLFFQTKCFKIILEDEKFVKGILGVLVIFLFMFPRDIITVQNPRFTTGLWLCIYVIMKSFHPATKGHKHLLWLLLAPTIHSSYWFLAPVIFLCIMVGSSVNRPTWLIVLVYISIPFSYLSLDIFSSNVNMLPFLLFSDTLGDWAFGYATSQAEQTQVTGSGFYWVPLLFGILKTTVYLIVPVTIIGKRVMINKSSNIGRLISCYLLLYVISNFLQGVPVLGVRFFFFVQIMSIYVLFKMYGFKSKIYHIIFFALAWDIFSRYFFGGAVSRVVPTIIFYTPLPYILIKYWGKTSMDVRVPNFNVEEYI